MIADTLTDALRAALAAAGLPEPEGGLGLEPTARREHGDFQTNLALRLAKAVGQPPREVAGRITAALEAAAPPHLERTEIAGPGFINLFLGPGWMHDVLAEVVTAGEAYGRGTTLDGRRINLEFVSANPTGPLHAGGGRWVAVGDALANVLAAQGATVHREYYLNDAGNQLGTFAASLMARYRGEEPPEDGYHGQYLVEMAARMRTELGDAVDEDTAREWGYGVVLQSLKDDLARIGVHFDTWFSERVLHERGEVPEVLEQLRASGHTYEREGATWLASEALGDQRDRVLVKGDGSTTYLANDLAYHRDKLRRGWEHLIDIWGADHHGQVRSLQCGLEAIGIGTAAAPEPEIILGQLVKLERGGELVKLSKRAGTVITLADILDEVDPDVCRLTFLLQGIDTAQTFDLDVVTSQSMENPVYYVQYAHARVASIARRAAEAGIARAPLAEVDLGHLTHERELDLLRALAEYPDVLASAADLRAPHRVTTWVRDFASRFHGFYRDCRVITDDPALTQARLWLAEAVRVGLVNALAILGVGAPEVMERLDADDEEAAG
ncbi:MAG: arginine--tRNA ligase [Actinomycetes bacterium]